MSCSSEPDATEREMPREVASGFSFVDDAFVFENFGGAERGPQLTPELVARMFGAEEVCAEGALPCELTPVAEIWMEAVNGTLNEGRSEGFAITSLLFHSGELGPQDFGGERVADLRLAGNPALQAEFAYWAATQSVPSAVENDVRFQAEDALPFLLDALKPDAEKHYRLAIAQRTETGFARGHAVTPIGLYKGEGDVYWLRIYDNNFPDKERRIELNPSANTWRYEVPPLDDSEPIVYEGTPENGNYLYFSAVEDRLGVLKAPFAADSGVRTINYSTMALVASRGDGEMETGIRDGQVLEAGDDKVVPAFSACPRCGADVPIINQTLIDMGIDTGQVIEIKTEGDVRSSAGRRGTFGRTVPVTVGETPGDGNMDWINAVGPNFSSTVTVDGDVSRDSVTFGEDGETTYTAASGNGVKIDTGTVTEDNQHLRFSVSVEGSDDPDVDVTVRITKGDDGEMIVEVENLPEGKSVELRVQRNNGDDWSDSSSEIVSFVSNGSTSRAVLNPEANVIAVENADDISGGHCNNGVLDPDYETDVDCGGGFCSPCRDGKICSVSDDCEGGTCETQGSASVCRATQCYDGVMNGNETDVDCGGPLCQPCVATTDNRSTPMCAANSDCEDSLCLGGRCRIKQSVVVVADRLPAGETLLRYRLDNVLADVMLTANGGEGPHEFVLGSAYQYQVDELRTCDTDYRVQITGITEEGDDQLQGTIEVACPEEGYRTLNAELYYQDGLAPISEDEPLTIEMTVDGVRSELELSGTLQRRGVGVFADSWSARVLKQPTGEVENPDNPGEVGSYSCTLPNATSYPNSPYNRNWNVRLSAVCSWTERATCADGLKNQDESDVDCGGRCAPCDRNKQCNTTTDCVSTAQCIAGVCAFVGSCDDGIQNQDETDLDCGGTVCGRCEVDESCGRGSDCISGICQGGVCIAPSCDDGIQNQDESDVDCGGSCPDRCALGESCSVGNDCQDSGCVANVCTESCDDATRNQDETDVDCGGSVCGGCSDGQTCSDAGDCASNYCLADVCATPSCSDGIQNQDEVGVDCGGSICDGCADGATCSVPGDCASNYCVSNVCTTASCSDAVQNQDESDVDCGGACGSTCTIGQSCGGDGDCAGGNCSGGVCAASCSDGIQNQDETGVDCGGSSCGGCGAGSVCTLDSDCSTDNCECAANSGNCAGNTGQCGAAKLVVDLPTTDGVAVSGSFTVPTQCSQVYVQAWGAAGGAGGDGGGGGPGGGLPGGGMPGGAGGYVSGTLNVSAGDVIDVWVGQGGDFGVVYDFGGTPGIGSKYGVITSGGLGDGDSFTGGGGGGGGLTSVRVSGSTSAEFVIPAGGGSSQFGAGDDVAAGLGGGAVDSNGEDAGFGSGDAGGGAGEVGGSFLGSNGGAAAGTYGTYPAGFSTADGINGEPANTTAPDYALCEGLSEGDVGAGANPLGSMWNAGGDGCVILRCVAP